MRYDKGIRGKVTKAGMRLVTIAIGSDFEWQGGVTQDEQRELMKKMQELADRWTAKLAQMKQQEEIDANEAAKQQPAAGPGVHQNGQPDKSAGKKTEGSDSSAAKPVRK